MTTTEVFALVGALTVLGVVTGGMTVLVLWLLPHVGAFCRDVWVGLAEVCERVGWGVRRALRPRPTRSKYERWVAEGNLGTPADYVQLLDQRRRGELVVWLEADTTAFHSAMEGIPGGRGRWLP